MPEIEEILVSVWRQALVYGAKSVEIDGQKYPVRETSRRRLKQVDFRFEDKELRGLEQNPDTKSRWAMMARQGKKVVQFLDGGREPNAEAARGLQAKTPSVRRVWKPRFQPWS